MHTYDNNMEFYWHGTFSIFCKIWSWSNLTGDTMGCSQGQKTHVTFMWNSNSFYLWHNGITTNLCASTWISHRTDEKWATQEKNEKASEWKCVNIITTLTLGFKCSHLDSSGRWCVVFPSQRRQWTCCFYWYDRTDDWAQRMIYCF